MLPVNIRVEPVSHSGCSPQSRTISGHQYRRQGSVQIYLSFVIILKLDNDKNMEQSHVGGNLLDTIKGYYLATFLDCVLWALTPINRKNTLSRC